MVQIKNREIPDSKKNTFEFKNPLPLPVPETDSHRPLPPPPRNFLQGKQNHILKINNLVAVRN